MPPNRCPNCRQIFWSNPHTGDFVHDCNLPQVGSSLKNEDVVIIGDWEDYSGSGTRPKGEVVMAGITNELDIAAKIGGKDFDEVTPRGGRAATHRQRPHLEYIEEPEKAI